MPRPDEWQEWLWDTSEGDPVRDAAGKLTGEFTGAWVRDGLVWSDALGKYRRARQIAGANDQVRTVYSDDAPQTPSKYSDGEGGEGSASLDALRDIQGQVALNQSDIAKAQLELEKIEADRRDARDK